MTDTKQRTQKPLKTRQYQIRALLRDYGHVTVRDVSDILNISRPYATVLLNGLIERKEVRIAYTEEGTGGAPRNVYALTDSYLKQLERVANSRKRDQRALQIDWVDAQPAPRKPWYRRAIEWLLDVPEALA